MRYIDKLSIRILAAVVVGFLLAGVGTKITYSCAPIDGAASCVSFDKAIMHPSDLLNNKQSSLAHFSENFVVVSLLSFGLLSIANLVDKKPKSANQAKA